MGRLRRLFGDQRGATAIEYGLICALVIVAMIAALSGFAGNVIRLLNGVSNNASAVL